MASKEVKQQIDIVYQNLTTVPQNMGKFSRSLRSLFAEYAVGTSSATAQSFRKLRDDTRNNAVVYVKGVLPVVKQCVSDIKGYFEYYQDLSMDEWWESIDYITEETKAHKEACNALIALHDDIITTLRKREDDTRVVINEMPHSSVKYEKTTKEPDSFSYIGYICSCVCSPICRCLSWIYSFCANTIFGAYEPIDLVKDAAMKKETEIQLAAAEVVRNNVIPALSKALDGLKGISGFFKAIHRELATLQNKGSNGKETGELKSMHYNTMRDRAGQMIAGCNGFFAALPSIRSDLEAIPKEGTDQNYVDRWMENQRKIITEQCSQMDSAKKLLNATTGSRN